MANDVLPSMPVMVRDFASSTSAAVMSNEQFGAYWRLLLCAWISDPPCTLPNDDTQLAAIARMSTRRWRSAGALVKTKFQPVIDDGRRLRNAKQWDQYQRARATRETNRSRGRAGARAKWDNTAKTEAPTVQGSSVSRAHALPEHGSRIAQASLEQRSRTAQADAQAQPEPCSGNGITKRKTQNTDVRTSAVEDRLAGSALVEWFDRIYARYPNKDCKVAANRAWIALGPSDRLARLILTALERRLAAGWVRVERRFIPQLRRYLEERQWEDAASTVEPDDPWVDLPHVWQCAVCQQMHEGTRDQMQQRVCLGEEAEGPADDGEA